MINASEEFTDHIKEREILCARITFDDDRAPVELAQGYTRSDFVHFIRMLMFDYDDGYGGQYLYGTIWYTDGTWSDRREYDGSEWWEYQRCPIIPQHLIAT